ncbi:hypothetical protein WJX82_006511 [Trebouxia sp. C0006]
MARARDPEMQGSNVVNSGSLDGMASRSLATSEHEEIQALATRTHGRRYLSFLSKAKQTWAKALHQRIEEKQH